MEYPLLTSNVNAGRNFHGWNCRCCNTASSRYAPSDSAEEWGSSGNSFTQREILRILSWVKIMERFEDYISSSTLTSRIGNGRHYLNKRTFTQGVPMRRECKVCVIFRDVRLLREYHKFNWSVARIQRTRTWWWTKPFPEPDFQNWWYSRWDIQFTGSLRTELCLLYILRGGEEDLRKPDRQRTQFMSSLKGASDPVLCSLRTPVIKK